MSVEKCDWANQENFFTKTNQDSTIYHSSKNLKMFNVTSVEHIIRDFLTYCFITLLRYEIAPGIRIFSAHYTEAQISIDSLTEKV